MADNMIYTGVSNSPINPVMDKVYKSPMDNIRFGAEDANVAKYVAYGKSETKELYLEPSYKTVISKTDAEYAFQRGMLIIRIRNTYLIPSGMLDGNIFTVDPTTPDGSLMVWKTSNT